MYVWPALFVISGACTLFCDSGTWCFPHKSRWKLKPYVLLLQAVQQCVVHRKAFVVISQVSNVWIDKNLALSETVKHTFSTIGTPSLCSAALDGDKMDLSAVFPVRKHLLFWRSWKYLWKCKQDWETIHILAALRQQFELTSSSQWHCDMLLFSRYKYLQVCLNQMDS